MVLLTLALLLGGSPAQSRPGLSGRGSSSADGPALSCDASTSCDLNFVADDYFGSGDWTSRDANRWTATLHGTLSVTASAQFGGRNGITGWGTSNYFSLAANSAHTIHGTDKFTYEIVLFNLANPGSRGTFLGGLVSAPNWAGYNFRHWPAGGDEFYITMASADNYYLGGTTSATLAISRGYIITITMDPGSPAFSVFLNGVKFSGGAFPDTTTSGSLTPVDATFGIGLDLRDTSSTSNMALAATTSYSQLVRHRSILSDTTIANRTAAFNALKGY